MSRIFKINFPVRDNNDQDLSIQERSFQHILVDKFGGFTVHSATGGWKNESGQLFIEDMRVFEVAAPDTAETELKVLELALHVGRVCEQQAVYCVMPSGQVQIIDTAKEWQREPSEACDECGNSEGRVIERDCGNHLCFLCNEAVAAEPGGAAA